MPTFTCRIEAAAAGKVDVRAVIQLCLGLPARIGAHFAARGAQFPRGECRGLLYRAGSILTAQQGAETAKHHHPTATRGLKGS